MVDLNISLMKVPLSTKAPVERVVICLLHSKAASTDLTPLSLIQLAKGKDFTPF